MIPLALATEDVLSETIGLRLLADLDARLDSPLKLRKGGFGYLRSKMDSWRQLAQQRLVFMLTDLDQAACVVNFVQDWKGGKPLPQNLLLRVAVREIESWVLADHEAMRKLIGPKGVLPADPDALPDPKQYLLKLAKQAPKPVRDDLVAAKGAMASQGLGYNLRLSNWVQNDWSPERAAERSPSLMRTRNRLREWVATWPDT